MARSGWKWKNIERSQLTCPSCTRMEFGSKHALEWSERVTVYMRVCLSRNASIMHSPPSPYTRQILSARIRWRFGWPPRHTRNGRIEKETAHIPCMPMHSRSTPLETLPICYATFTFCSALANPFTSFSNIVSHPEKKPTSCSYRQCLALLLHIIVANWLNGKIKFRQLKPVRLFKGKHFQRRPNRVVPPFPYLPIPGHLLNASACSDESGRLVRQSGHF